jgi:hypothetical protein
VGEASTVRREQAGKGGSGGDSPWKRDDGGAEEGGRCVGVHRWREAHDGRPWHGGVPGT